MLLLWLMNNIDTEIDWIAYMQEVSGYLDGERNYSNLKGDTGPLVYPAGFVYIFVILRWMTDSGLNIFKGHLYFFKNYDYCINYILGQCIFAFLYLIVLLISLQLYKNKDIPKIALVSLILSKRIHSIFMLRMFNDCVAILLSYISIYLFTKKNVSIYNHVSNIYLHIMSHYLFVLSFFVVFCCFLLF